VALLSAIALMSATPVASYAKDKTTPAPAPPATMSTVGGARLGIPGTQVSAGAPALPKNLTARSWIVADAESGDVLAAKNAHWKQPPASTLKMLFADTVIPKFPQTMSYKVASSDLDGMGEGSSLVGIKAGLTYTVRDLWLGVFLRSGNDAVHVLSAMNHGVDRTVLEMRARAADLQADDTTVVTPDGYDMPGQDSSAYDLTLFARAGLQNADFRQYCSTVSAQFPGDWKKTKGGKKVRGTFAIQNTDRLLSGIDGVSPYQGIAGVKNGYTTNAGNTFTGVAQRGGRTLLVTVMHPAPGLNEVYKEASSLLDWGFAASGKVAPVGTLVPPKSALATASPTATGSGAAAGTQRGGGPTEASAVSGSPADGAWTALGIAGGSVVVVGGIVLLVRRRWPLPKQW